MVGRSFVVLYYLCRVHPRVVIDASFCALEWPQSVARVVTISVRNRRSVNATCPKAVLPFLFVTLYLLVYIFPQKVSVCMLVRRWKYFTGTWDVSQRVFSYNGLAALSRCFNIFLHSSFNHNTVFVILIIAGLSPRYSPGVRYFLLADICTYSR